jgi:DNA helicase-2/ATP-dependent DNA helicase PcrA
LSAGGHDSGVLARLDPHQRTAVLADGPATLVSANVGSGKTTVLIAKVLHLHLDRGVPLRDLVVLTFTNKAANEIKERMLRADPTRTEADMPYFGTFHAVAMKLLRTSLPVETLGFTRDFTVIDPDELVELASQLILEMNLNVRYRNRLSARLEALRSGRKEFGRMQGADDIQALWQAVEARKRATNRMDFDDLIHHATSLLEERGPSVYAPQWILVDEFQDSDEKLLRFVDALKTPDTKLFAVGDPNQVIYSWRGGSRNVFQDFVQRTGATVVDLPLSYRSSGMILDAAGCFLTHPKKLEGMREAGSRVAVRRHHDPFNEAEHLAGRITRLHEQGMSWREVAVLYRTQRQSAVLESVFRKAGIPVEVSLRRTFKDIPVLQWLLKLLRAAVNPEDAGSLLGALTHPTFGEGLKPAAARKVLAAVDDVPEIVRAVRGFRAWAKKEAVAEEAGVTAVAAYDYFGLDEQLSPTSSDFPTNRTYAVSLLEAVERLAKTKKCGFLDATAEFLHVTALHGIDALKEDLHRDDDAVRLMTLHACKGLEFTCVFIIGANPGLVPLPSRSEEALEEEKRLFFVGMTRARDELEISYYNSPDDPRVLSGPSSFLSMIPEHLLSMSDDSAAAETPEVVLRNFRKEIRGRIEQRGKDREETVAAVEDSEPAVAEEGAAPAVRRVRHAKYGLGIVVSEDEEAISVDFENYGMKSFAEAFAALEEA